ncbi:hypothetical protein SCLCIDRAFT_471892 [Scleroderma citrinum Foug A]|uniref:Condensin complex subunit 1 C-terminal domain-containing protein n=1 Tax=Scleroderma citrinum Foug A TaxID=1036808 RepID=A0A0C3DY60_9AGAM|nr:hypothetical protein SCLCIDRAFT_471892 [Scleroderma citrinum Foug A]
MGGVFDLIPTLYNDHDTVLVSVMRTLTGLARYGEARKIMCAVAIVPTLLNLARRFNDFITPAAIDLLCLLLDEASMQTSLMNGALPLFVEMTGKASDMVKQTGVKALVEFAKHDEKRLIKEGCVVKLAKQARSYQADHQDGAIRSLVVLNAHVPTIVRDALTEANTVETLISRLQDKSHCLTAASALVSLMTIGKSRACGSNFVSTSL